MRLAGPLRPDTEVQTRFGGRLRGADLIGRAFRYAVPDSRGRLVRVLDPSLPSYTLLMPRAVTPVRLPPAPSPASRHRFA